LILSRQNLPVFKETKANVENLSRGAYELEETNSTPDVILIATGSEVSLAVNAKTELEKENISVRVVAMPSWELFSQQSKEYKEEVLPSSNSKRVAIEMGISLGWERFVGYEGKTLSIETFGASGDGEAVMKQFGYTAENVVRMAKSVLQHS
jgi:transketolase